jgi:hypothetical protein
MRAYGFLLILVLVGIAGYVMATLYKYMWTYLSIDRIHT